MHTRISWVSSLFPKYKFLIYIKGDYDSTDFNIYAYGDGKLVENSRVNYDHHGGNIEVNMIDTSKNIKRKVEVDIIPYVNDEWSITSYNIDTSNIKLLSKIENIGYIKDKLSYSRKFQYNEYRGRTKQMKRETYGVIYGKMNKEKVEYISMEERTKLLSLGFIIDTDAIIEYNKWPKSDRDKY